MTTYKAPLGDIDFVLREFCRLGDISQLPAFADVDVSVVSEMLAEAARFFEESFAPLNVVGDKVGSHRNDDGTVTTPPGSKRPTRPMSKPDGERSGSRPVSVAEDSRGS